MLFIFSNIKKYIKPLGAFFKPLVVIKRLRKKKFAQAVIMGTKQIEIKLWNTLMSL